MLAINLRANRSKCKSWIIFVSSFFLIFINITVHSQVISHELRRLAVSTNQFGIDALRALDRIEPPEKVIVFCPVCLSSSLTMIMMGSSKYQVVSSLRQALYIWSMKPKEINQGFRDIFEHIGFNQPTTVDKAQIFDSSRAKLSLDRAKSDQAGPNRYKRSFDQKPIEPCQYMTRHGSIDGLSLPRLIKLRELMDRTLAEPWWYRVSQNISQPDYSRGSSAQYQSLRMERNTSATTQSLAYISNKTTTGVDHERLLGDMSQMSALSNIYIQRGLTMNYNYNLLLRQFFKTVIHPVDFIRNWDETRQHINSLVASGTEGKVKELIKRNSYEQKGKPKIMLISTFHFRGTLDIQVKNSDAIKQGGNTTSRGGGTTNTSRPVEVQGINNASGFIDTEENLMKFGKFPAIGCNVIEIPFNNRLISLIVVMPIHVNMTELLLTKLSAQVLNDMVNSLTVRRISIEIPVIKFDRGPINVEGLLKELGLSDSFFGDKAYSTESGLNRWLRPSDIVHETSIDIGTINPKWAQTEDRLKVGAHESRLTKATSNRTTRSTSERHLRLNKPFFYFVFDSINGLVLTMGRIRL